MALLYLIRHARTQMMGAASQRWPLSEKGRREARILARQGFWRDVTLIISSPEPKALQTAEPAARRWGIPLETAGCLREIRRPRLLKNYDKVIADLFAKPETSVAGLESAIQVANRATRCIKELIAAHPRQTLAVVSHGLLLTVFLAQLENRWPTVAEWRAIPFPGVAVLDTTAWHLTKNWSRYCETF